MRKQKKFELPDIDQQACIGCGNCAAWCPAGAVQIVDGKAVIVDPEKCDYCTDCESVCPVGAIACRFEIILIGKDAKKNKQ